MDRQIDLPVSIMLETFMGTRGHRIFSNTNGESEPAKQINRAASRLED